MSGDAVRPATRRACASSCGRRRDDECCPHSLARDDAFRPRLASPLDRFAKSNHPLSFVLGVDVQGHVHLHEDARRGTWRRREVRDPRGGARPLRRASFYRIVLNISRARDSR